MTTATAGQQLVIGLAGPVLTPATTRLLDTVRPRGVVLFARNIDTADQVRRLTAALRDQLGSELLIAIDQEHGRVNRLRNIVGELPRIAHWKQAGDPQAVREFGRETGRLLRDLGVNLDFAPVLDLELFDDTVDNALRERCWGRTAEEVIIWAAAFIDGLRSEGVMACPKHFPGLGGARADSHETLPTITRSAAELWEQDVKPYRELLPRCPAVMVGHVLYPALDTGAPASLSSKVIAGWLRERLGFHGLVITDDLEMGALRDPAVAALAARRAGADLMLVCHTPAKILEVHAALAR